MSGTQDAKALLDDDSFKKHSFMKHKPEPEDAPLEYQLQPGKEHQNSDKLKSKPAVRISQLLRPYFTKLVPDTSCFLEHFEDLKSLLQGGRWGILIPESVLRELIRISAKDTDPGSSAQEALQAIRTSINTAATISIISSEGADITRSAMLPRAQQDLLLNSTEPMNIDNDIIDVIKDQELSKHQELHLPSDFDGYDAKSAVLVTDDRALHLKASAYGIYSVSPSVFRSLQTDEE